MGFFTPKYASKDEQTALRALEKISDYNTLRKIALSFSMPEGKRAQLKIRAIAALKMHDIALCTYTVCLDGDDTAFSSFIDSSNDLDLLETINEYLKKEIDTIPNSVGKRKIVVLRCKELTRARFQAMKTDKERIEFFLSQQEYIDEIELEEFIAQIHDKSLLQSVLEGEDAWGFTRRFILDKLGISLVQGYVKGYIRDYSDKQAAVKQLTIDDFDNIELTVPYLIKLSKDYVPRSLCEQLLDRYANEKLVNDLIDILCNDWHKDFPWKKSDTAMLAAATLAALYRKGKYKDLIKKYDGTVLEKAGKMPKFNMNDPLERDFATGYKPRSEIQFCPSDVNGKRFL